MTAASPPEPPPVPPDARSVLLFGGSFDPPHRGHSELPELVRTRLGMDWILYVPAARSPHKRDAPGATGPQRVEMLRAALPADAPASIWRTELERAAANPSSPSYTIDTIRAFRRLRPDCSLRLLIGADQARSFHLWREPGAILRLAPPAVMLRDGGGTAAAGDAELVNHLARFWPGEIARRWASWIVHVPRLDISATDLRRRLAGWDGQSDPADLTNALPRGVLEYLRANPIYR